MSNHENHSKGWIVVTGASSGIGEETANHLLQMGYSVVVTARNEEKLNTLFGNQENVLIMPSDLSQIENIQEYAREVVRRVGPIRGLVHSAGVDATVPINMIKAKKMVEIFNTNTFAALLLVSNFSKKDHYVPDASFVLVSSLSAHEGAYAKSLYAASKGALEGFLISAAPELAEKGIRINGIAPGIVKTKMVEESLSKMSTEQVHTLTKDYLLGLGDPSDISQLIGFLIGGTSRWMTGQTIVIDGGHLARKC